MKMDDLPVCLPTLAESALWEQQQIDLFDRLFERELAARQLVNDDPPAGAGQAGASER